MPFDADFKHWPTLAAFVAYLRDVPRPPWLRRVTNHNTYIPNEFQWRGLASMRSIAQTYIGKGWERGPHLFLAAECPNPADRGIWQMTPLSHQGVHAGPCNIDALGIENVGDFDARPPTPAQYKLLIDVNLALLHAWGLTPTAVNVHNECMPGRTCPGRHLDANKLRADLQRGAASFSALGRYRFRAPQAVFTARDPKAPLASGPVNGMTIYSSGDDVTIGDITAGWGWIDTGIGFVPMSVLERI